MRGPYGEKNDIAYVLYVIFLSLNPASLKLIIFNLTYVKYLNINILLPGVIM